MSAHYCRQGEVCTLGQFNDRPDAQRPRKAAIRLGSCPARELNHRIICPVLREWKTSAVEFPGQVPKLRSSRAIYRLRPDLHRCSGVKRATLPIPANRNRRAHGAGRECDIRERMQPLSPTLRRAKRHQTRRKQVCRFMPSQRERLARMNRAFHDGP
jgi:hypothetical protein